MEIIQVTDKKTITAFHKLPLRIYKNDNNWVPPLKMMIESIFNPEKNTGFIHGDARRWLVKKGNQGIGRIAAFYDRSKIIFYFTADGRVDFLNARTIKKLPTCFLIPLVTG